MKGDLRALMFTMNERRSFHSYDQKNARFLRQADNLSLIASEDVHWKVYNVKYFKRANFDNESFDEQLSYFSEVIPKYDVNIGTIAGLTYSVPSIIIELYLKSKAVYSAIVISVCDWGSDGIANVILLIKKAPRGSAMLTIHEAIENSFQCKIRPMMPSEKQLSWLIGIALQESLRRSIQNSELVMTYTPLLEFNADIKFKLPGEVLQERILDKVPGLNENVLSIADIRDFFEEFNECLYSLFKIKVANFLISSFELKDIFLAINRNEFIFKVKRPEILFALLSYIEADCLKE